MLCIAVLALMIASSCGAPAPPTTPLTIDELIDRAGRDATPPTTPQAPLTIDQLIERAERSAEYVAPVDMIPGTVKSDLDILYTPEQWRLINEGNNATEGPSKRKASSMLFHRWVDATVPFEYQTGAFNALYTDDDIKATIQEAMDAWSAATCLKFRPATTSDVDMVVYQRGIGCRSYIGKQGGKQPITLQSGCEQHAIIVHEIGHAIGWAHEQMRPDRDDYITINFDAVEDGMEDNFSTWPYVNYHGVPYDYLSIMHYGSQAFSKDGTPTIVPKDSSFLYRIGQRFGFSFRDVKLANLMYDCAGKSQCPEQECPGEGFVDKNCKCQCPSGGYKNGDPTVECGETAIATTTPSFVCKDKYPSSCSYYEKTSGYCVYASFRTDCPQTCGRC